MCASICSYFKVQRYFKYIINFFDNYIPNKMCLDFAHYLHQKVQIFFWCFGTDFAHGIRPKQHY